MKRKNIILLSTILALIAIYLLICLIPSPVESWKEKVCRLSAKSCYAIPTEGGDTLYLSLHDGSAPIAALCADSLKDSVETSGVFVSQAGHIATSDSLILSSPDTMDSKVLKKTLCILDTLTEQERHNRHGKLEELNYYANTHSAIDDGYNEVMAYREKIKKQVVQSDSLLLLIRKTLKEKNPVATRQTKYSLHHFFRKNSDSTSSKYILLLENYHLKECTRNEGLLLLQLQEGILPRWAKRFSVHRFGAFGAGRKLVAFNDFGGFTSRDSAAVLYNNATIFPTAEGGAWVNASGQLCGIQRHGQRVSSRQLAHLLRSEHTWPVWWWNNISAKAKQIFSSSKEGERRGKTVQSYNLNPCVCVTLSDSSLYEGQAETAGGKNIKREGYGRLTMPDGTIYKGIWRSDTLAYGIRLDSLGIYEGGLDLNLQAQGTGSYLSLKNEDYYSGQWRADRRHGHGFSSRADKMVRCGEWKNDSFQGERMVYTADRVYGIDISRYQHGKGRRYIPILWDRLRITSLGSGRRVTGNVDYPVSFAYIKATEGRSLLNKYYSADLRQARRHGIPVGSYHFFSSTSTGAQQAAYFLKMAWVAKSDLPPVLDLEPTEKQINQMGGDAKMFQQVLVWLRMVEKARGKRPVLYVGQQFVNKHLPNAPVALRGYDVWIARYGEFKPYVKLLHWQLTPYGHVRGITGEVDINVFNGTKEQFKKYLQTH